MAFKSQRGLLQRKLQFEGAKLDYLDARDRMFLPAVTLDFSTGSDFTLGTLPRTTAATTGAAAMAQGYPSTTIGLKIGSYTLFNFFKDWTAWEITRMTWERAQQQYREFERTTRFGIMKAYFQVRTDQEKLDAVKRSVEISEAIVAAMKSRKELGKATDREVDSSSMDLLNAKNEYNSSLRSLKGDLWNLNLLLGDPIDTPYELKSDLKYEKIKITPEEAFKIYMERSPQILDARLDLKRAQMNIELMQKNKLPLPTLKFNGVSVSYSTGYYGSNPPAPPTTDASSSQGNIDINASLSMTINLLGPSGFFGLRDVTKAYYQRESTELGFAQTENAALSTLLTQVNSAILSEGTIDNQKEALKKAGSVLEGIFSEIFKGGDSRLEWRDAIVQARTAELSLRDSVLSHFNSKLGIAELIGVDLLPGDVVQ